VLVVDKGLAQVYESPNRFRVGFLLTATPHDGEHEGAEVLPALR
jgi:hypothetical protein